MHAAESAKVTAERALHELQLDMRSQVEKYNQLHEARRYTLACMHLLFVYHACDDLARLIFLCGHCVRFMLYMPLDVQAYNHMTLDCTFPAELCLLNLIFQIS